MKQKKVFMDFPEIIEYTCENIVLDYLGLQWKEAGLLIIIQSQSNLYI